MPDKSSLLCEAKVMYDALEEVQSSRHSRLPRCIVERYVGSVDAAGLFDGEGAVQSCMGFVYDGEWRHDRPAGRGLMRWSSGVEVDGEFHDGAATGHGSVRWPNGSLYEGNLLHGVRHGTGRLVSQDGKVRYEGQWSHGKREGGGVQYYRDGSCYEGTWRQDRRHGKGCMRYANGDCYDGEWWDDVREGRGTMAWCEVPSPDTSRVEGRRYAEIYDGDWHAGQPHGEGIVTYIRYDLGYQQATETEVAMTATTREATWAESPAHFAPPARAVVNAYHGNFVSGARNGYGAFYYADGSRYEGMWREGRKDGRGCFTTAEGIYYEAKFARDELVQGSMPWSDPAGGPHAALNSSVAVPAALLVPRMCISDLLQLTDGTIEELHHTIHSLLLRFNTHLKDIFQHYAQMQDGVTLCTTSRGWWRHRLPGHIAVPQLLRLCSDTGIVSGSVTISTVLLCIAAVVAHETAIAQPGGAPPATCGAAEESSVAASVTTRPGVAPNVVFEGVASKHMQRLTRTIPDADGFLNYRQFAETLVRLAAVVCVGPAFVTLGSKFHALVTRSLGAEWVTYVARPLCPLSRLQADVVDVHMPTLRQRFAELIEACTANPIEPDRDTCYEGGGQGNVASDASSCEGNCVRRVVVPLLPARSLARLVVEPVCAAHTMSLVQVLRNLFLVCRPCLPHATSPTSIVPGVSHPLGNLSAAVLTASCGADDELLVNGVVMQQELTFVDFVETVLHLACLVQARKQSGALHDILLQDIFRV